MNKRFHIFKNKVFRNYFFASLIDTLGEGIFSLTSVVLIVKYSGSVMDISYMLVLTMLPSVFLAPFSGAILDRFNKAKVAYYFNIVRFLMILLLPICLLLHLFTVKILYVSILISYIAWYVVVPAQEAMLKEAIDEDQYVDGVAYTQAAWQVGLLSSALLAGFLMKYSGMSTALLVSSACFLVSCLLLWRISHLHHFGNESSHEGGETVQKYLVEIKEGWMYLFDNKAGLYFSLASCITIPFFSAINILLAPFNYHILNGNELTLGTIDCMAGIGSLISAVFCLRVAMKKSLPMILNGSLFLLGIVIAIFSWTQHFIGAFSVYLLVGLFIGNVKVLSKSLVYEYIETEYVGRTMTTISMISLALAIVFSLVVGALGEKGIRLAYIVVAFTLLGPIVLTLLGMKHSRQKRITKSTPRSSTLG